MQIFYLEILNFYLIIFIMLVSVILMFKRLKQGNMTFIFYGYHFVILGLMQVISTILGGDKSFPIDIRFKADVLASIVILSFLIGESFTLQILKMYKKSSSREYILEKIRNDSFLSIIIWVVTAFSILGLALYVKTKGIPFTKILSYETRTIYRSTGTWFGQILGSYLFSLIMISIYIALIKNNWKILFLDSLIVYILMSMSGTRAYIFYLLGPLTYYYIGMRKLFKKIKLTNTFIIIVAIFMFSIIFEAIHLWRWLEMRTFSNLIKVLFDLKTYNFLLNDDASELNYRIKIFQAVELFPKYYDWLYGNTYVNIFLFWLPSGVSKGLKIDTIYKFADAIYGTSSSYLERASIQPSFVGDCYINFGYLLWIPALMWGVLFSTIFVKADRDILWNIISGSSIVYLLALLMRGSIYLASYRFILNTIFIIGIIFFEKLIIRKEVLRR